MLARLHEQEINDETSPSFLEILSATEFEKLINPTVKYLQSLLLYRYHNKFLFTINNNIDELLLLIECLYNYRLLREENSTFIKLNYEYQYGSSKKHDRLSIRQCLVIIGEDYILDYVWNKLDTTHEKRKNTLEREKSTRNRERLLNGEEELTDQSILDYSNSNIEKLFLTYYPGVKRTYKLSNFIFKMLYLKKVNGSLSLLQCLTNIKMFRYIEEDGKDDTSLSVATNRSTSTIKNRLTNLNLNKYITWAFQFLRGSMTNHSKIFKVILYLIKIFQYYSSTELIQNIKTRLTDISHIPPPPPRPSTSASTPQETLSSETEKQGYESSNVCKLCHSEIVNPAILETGYVFCYNCIVKYYKESLENEKETAQRKVYCPVSGTPLLHDINHSIRRLLL